MEIPKEQALDEQIEQAMNRLESWSLTERERQQRRTDLWNLIRRYAVGVSHIGPGQKTVMETAAVLLNTPDRVSILAEATRIVDGPRRADYGTPAENHGRTAKLWNVYLEGREPRLLTARDVCMLNALQKISRDRHAPKRDNLVDIAGYAENADLCEGP